MSNSTAVRASRPTSSPPDSEGRLPTERDRRCRGAVLAPDGIAARDGGPARSPTLPALVGLLILAVAPGLATAQDRGRAGMLHETHCLGCHSTSVYTRDDRKVGSFDDLKAQVAKWQALGSLKWNDADIDLVARELNELYYRLPCPTEAC